MANEQNLVSLADRPQRERNEIASKGAHASNKKQRRRKTMAELTHALMSQRLTDEERDAIVEAHPDLDDEDATLAVKLVSKQLGIATMADAATRPADATRAFTVLAELDERATAREHVRHDYRMCALDMTTDFLPVYRRVWAVYDGRDATLREVVAKGGRGGAKSSQFAELAYEVIRRLPQANVVYTRRYQADLRPTVFKAMCRVIERHGDAASWDVTTRPMECVYRPTGQRVYFFGADNPLGTKSFTPDVGYVALLIHEEADEMQGMDELEDAELTYLRANGVDHAPALDVKIFNPPPSRANFMNRHAAEMATDPSCLVADFDYRNVPPEWLGERFVERAEWLWEHKPERARNLLGGEVTGDGGELFANVVERAITDAEVEAYEGRGIVWQGLDFGYEHPMAFVRVAYDPDADEVVALFEQVERRCKLGQFLRPLDAAGYRSDEVICDSAEPDRIDQMLDWGWDAVRAVKRWKGGGRAYGWDWLRQRCRITVDPARTPELARELRELEFERVRGGYSSRYPTDGEDAVMATIYALNRVIRDAAEYDGYDVYDDDSEV